MTKEKVYKKVYKLFRKLILLAIIFMIMILAVWGPEVLAEYQDKGILSRIEGESIGAESEGYRYSLSSNEKLYILSKCLSNQILPESDQSARTKNGGEMDYQELTGSYAFVVNQEDPTGEEITQEEIWESCNRSMELFYDLGILPGEVKDVTELSYDAVLYSAIDVLEPRNNLAVWKVSLATGKRNADKSGRLIDACIDADTGKVYEFYVRCDTTWEEIDPDDMIVKWREYMGLTGGEAYEEVNPLLETTPYYKKYSFTGNGQENTIVTIGFYEGINELFLKVSR